MRVPTASPAVQSDILHRACTRQVLSGESGASVRSGDCGGLENLTRAKLLLENSDLPETNKAAEFTKCKQPVLMMNIHPYNVPWKKVFADS